MNTLIDEDAAMELANALALASVATGCLLAEGVRVVAAFANGRRPLLVVDRMPGQLQSVIKMIHPNGRGGRTVVRATRYRGCQLEWMEDVASLDAPIVPASADEAVVVPFPRAAARASAAQRREAVDVC